jgi:oligopeptide/dipeptide ABC transporter ATP-binding protein
VLRTEERPATAAAEAAPLLGVEGLTLEVATDGGPVRLVEEVSFAIGPGEVLGLVGESGCGKSVTAMSVLRLLPEPPTRIAAGAVRFRGLDLARADRRTLKGIRGREIGMIFQEPMTSLNPAFSVGWQLAEALRLHTDLRRGALRERLVEVLRQVGIGAPERRLAQYPHELSGGLRQRVMIAMALACGPRLLIADEPTTALDVTVQLQILELIAALRRETGLAVLLITHDLGLVAEYADRVAVMYAGRIVETGPAASLFARPRHPYTVGLLAARPRLHGAREALVAIPGTVPSPRARPPGCPFQPRCSRRLERCAEMPPLAGVGGHQVACWNLA